MEISNISATLGQPQPLVPLSLPLEPKWCEIHWYAAYTSANHEKRVAQQLQRRSVESYLPLYESVRRWKDRRVRLQLPLFPGYVFVRIALREKLRVLEVPGVARLVGFDGNPTPIPPEDIEVVRACLNGNHAVQPHGYIRRGQRVRVMSGPMAGLTGVVVREGNRARFVVSLELLKRSVAVELEGTEVVAQ
jgi:transcription antitermination factor NusG